MVAVLYKGGCYLVGETTVNPSEEGTCSRTSFTHLSKKTNKFLFKLYVPTLPGNNRNFN